MKLLLLALPMVGCALMMVLMMRMMAGGRRDDDRPGVDPASRRADLEAEVDELRARLREEPS